jgi:large subunit ribosomal protein L24
MAARIRVQDEVVVISGRDRGKRGRVLRILSKKGKVVVEGVNIVTRHLRRNPANPSAGGRVERPAPIPLAKVMPWSEADKAGSRVRFAGSGRTKHRVSAATGAVIGSTGSGREKKAAKAAAE